MTNQHSMFTDGPISNFSFSSRDLVAIVFRYKRPILISFFAVLLGAALAAIFMPAEYQVSTEFLIERARIDPIVSPGQTNSANLKTDVTEEELNSEVELVKSEDVMREVVLASGLQNPHSWLGRFSAKVLGYVGLSDTEQERIAKAVTRLQRDLKVDSIKKSNVISVTYSASDPRLAAKVLQALDDSYLQKNVAVHHPAGEFQFFEQETEAYQKSLSDAEGQLKAFSEQEGGVSPQLARDITLQKLSDFTATLRQTYADIAAAQQRIDSLQKQAGLTPQRLTTQSRTSDDAQVLQGLKSTLMSLELKRTEMLTKYKPDYPLVQEVDKQLTETQASIAAEEAKPLRDETTDRNPTYAWINEELAKAKAEEAGLQARAAATETIIAKYQANAHDLEQKGIQQQDLLRRVKTEEENYLLYEHKREEARMTDALDRTRILNVAIAEAPVTPALPAHSRWTIFGIGALLAFCVSIGFAFTLEYSNPSFRTPTEVLSELNIPVLAAVPQHSNGFHPNGNEHAGVSSGNGNGTSHSNGNGNGNGHGLGLGLTDLVGHDSNGE